MPKPHRPCSGRCCRQCERPSSRAVPEAAGPGMVPIQGGRFATRLGRGQSPRASRRRRPRRQLHARAGDRRHGGPCGAPRRRRRPAHARAGRGRPATSRRRGGAARRRAFATPSRVQPAAAIVRSSAASCIGPSLGSDSRRRRPSTDPRSHGHPLTGQLAAAVRPGDAGRHGLGDGAMPYVPSGTALRVPATAAPATYEEIDARGRGPGRISSSGLLEAGGSATPPTR